MGGLIAAAYGLLVYVLFLGTLLYTIAFVGNLPLVPKTIDSGEPATLPGALIVNTLLLGLFAVQHSVMARQGFKRWWTRLVPPSVERSTYVLATVLVLVAMLAFWQPMPQTVWQLEHPVAVAAVEGLFWAGWGIVLLSTFLINHWELFGVQQVYHRLRGTTPAEPKFATPLLYRYVRHPIYLGFLLAFWAAPEMSRGHLLFAVATTGYVLIGASLEERDLIRHFGEQYRAYRRQVGMLLPLPRRGMAGRRSSQ